MLTSLCGGCARKSERALANDAIRDSFYQFQQAVAAGDGDAAASRLSMETHRHFEHLREAALTGAEADLRRAPLEFQLDVLRLRACMTASELGPLSGPELAARFVSEQWLNSRFLSQLRLGNIIHSPRGAEACLADEQGLTTSRLVFRYEDAEWRLDLAAAGWMQRRLLQQAIATRQVSQDEVLQEVLRPVLRERSLNELWKPLLGAVPAITGESPHSPMRSASNG